MELFHINSRRTGNYLWLSTYFKSTVQRHESFSTTFPSEVATKANSVVAVPTTYSANEGRWLVCRCRCRFSFSPFVCLYFLSSGLSRLYTTHDGQGPSTSFVSGVSPPSPVVISVIPDSWMFLLQRPLRCRRSPLTWHVTTISSPYSYDCVLGACV